MEEQGNKSAIFICLPANLSELSKGGRVGGEWGRAMKVYCNHFGLTA